MQPDKGSVLESIEECRTIGDRAFLKKHASERPPRTYYLVFEGRCYPLKAIWAGAYCPPIHTRDFDTDEARTGLAALGFKEFFPDRIQKNSK